MCFHRRTSLGRYNASREEWVSAYRFARQAIGEGKEPDPKTSGVTWKAQLIAAYERVHVDNLTIPLEVRLFTHKMIN